MHRITEKDIQEVIRKIVEGVNPEKIILFGSFAEGKTTADSDVDLLVILDTYLPRLKRHVHVSRFIRPHIFPVDLIVITPEEAKRSMEWTNSAIRDAIESGRVMYEKNDVAMAQKGR